MIFGFLAIPSTECRTFILLDIFVLLASTGIEPATSKIESLARHRPLCQVAVRRNRHHRRFNINEKRIELKIDIAKLEKVNSLNIHTLHVSFVHQLIRMKLSFCLPYLEYRL